ncbi:matrixin family metalloprotease [Actinomadura vinacea]
MLRMRSLAVAMAAAGCAAPAPPALAGPAVADRCRPLEAGALPQVVELDRCDVRGRVIRGVSGAAATVPADGTSVTARTLRPEGTAELEIRVDGKARTATIVERPPEARPHPAAAPLRACSDTARRLATVRWPRGSRIDWHYYQGSAAHSGMRPALAATAVRRGVSGAVNARTDCVRGSTTYRPKPDIGQRYAGTTRAYPNIGGPGDCRDRDGVNSFGYATLSTVDADALAVTCTWHVGGTILEGDIAIQTNGKRWWTPRSQRRGSAQPVPGCPAGRYEAVSVITHEMLHVLGLQHYEGARHQNLSMSPYVRTCDDRAATLGRGDYQGLIALYGADSR